MFTHTDQQSTRIQDGVGQTLDKLLPELRIEVDKRLRRLCSGKLEGSSFSSADYSWIIRAYLVSMLFCRACLMVAQGRRSGGDAPTQSHTWTLSAMQQTLDDHGVRLHSKPRTAVSASALYEPTPGEAAKDSLAVGVVPIAPTVDRGGIPGVGAGLSYLHVHTLIRSHPLTHRRNHGRVCAQG